MLKYDQLIAIECAVMQRANDIRNSTLPNLPVLIRETLESIQQFDFTCCLAVFEQAYDHAVDIINKRINGTEQA